MAILFKLGATPLDAIFSVPRSHYDFASAEGQRSYLRDRLLISIVRFMCGFPGIGAAAMLVLVRAFVSSRRDARQFLLGPIPGSRLHRKAALVQGEILIGIIAAVWLLRVAANLISSSGSGRIIADSYVVAAIAFWGTLVQLAWRGRWHSFWRWSLVVLWCLIVLFVTSLLLYFGVYFTTIIASMVLGAAIVCAASWLIDRFVAVSPLDTSGSFDTSG